MDKDFEARFMVRGDQLVLEPFDKAPPAKRIPLPLQIMQEGLDESGEHLLSAEGSLGGMAPQALGTSCGQGQVKYIQALEKAKKILGKATDACYLLTQPKAGNPAPAMAKEPWQMTREEFLRPFYEAQFKAGRVTRQDMEQDLAEAIRRPPIFGESAHKQRVQQALSEGKPVPPEVLAEYPDLAAQAAKTVPRAEVPPAARRLTIAEQEQARLAKNAQELAALEARQAEAAAARAIRYEVGDVVKVMGDERRVTKVLIEPTGEVVYRVEGLGQPVGARQMTLVSKAPAAVPPSPSAAKASVKVDVCAALAQAQDIHQDYTHLPPDPKTGSHDWHRHWIQVYKDARRLMKCPAAPTPGSATS